MPKTYTFAQNEDFLMKDVESKYQQLLTTILRYENGDISNSMIKHGLVYKKNYGVSIPVLNKIAIDYPLNNELAIYLWNRDERESKLLALRIFSTDVELNHNLDVIIEGIVNSELAEQAAQYYFSRLDNPVKYVSSLMINKNEFCNLAGLILVSKIAQTNKELENKVFLQFLNEFKNMKICQSFHQKRGLARALLQIGLRNNELKQEAIQWIELQIIENLECKNWFEQEVTYYLTN